MPRKKTEGKNPHVVKLTARCVSCKHKWVMTAGQLSEAQSLGTACCPKCYSPATVEKAKRD